MMEKRKLRIFCPTHEAAFEVEESPKILCEITEHSLSIDFPNSEIWEFCCNCETFAPSRLDKGEIARKNCYGCEGEISKFFVCESCKTVSFECKTRSKGRSYFINPEKGITPNCPSCQNVGNKGKLVLHQCEEISAGFITAQQICPFCLEKTAKTPLSTVKSQNIESKLVCPNCSSENQIGTAFCGNCRNQLRTNVTVVNPGTQISKTQVLGSLCPNCSTPIPPDSGFCGECGQVVKNILPLPPAPPKKKVNQGFSKVDVSSSVNNELSKSTPQKEHTFKIIAGVGVGFLLLIFIVTTISLSKNRSGIKTNLSSKNSNQTPSTTLNHPTLNGSSTPNSNSSTLPSSFERDYKGTINGQTFYMSLVRNGSSLSGTASTGRTDTVSGTIDENGEFQLKGFENGTRFTGLYFGHIFYDGTITGYWTTTQGKKETTFSLAEQ